MSFLKPGYKEHPHFGNLVYPTLYDTMKALSGCDIKVPVVPGGQLYVNGVQLYYYECVALLGDRTYTSDQSTYFTNEGDYLSSLVVVKGNLTISSGHWFIPPTRKLFMCLYVTGNLVINGMLSMTTRGANHGAYGYAPQNIRIANGIFSGITNPTIPAGGAGGGAAVVRNNGAQAGNPGYEAGTFQTGGGGSGGANGSNNGTGVSGAGSQGTSFSGGQGGGGARRYSSGNSYAGGGTGWGGAGGNGATNDNAAGGGAGNPGGYMGGGSGTGGTLIFIVEGNVTGGGGITSAGAGGGGDGNYGAGGGGAGGGCLVGFVGGNFNGPGWDVSPGGGGGCNNSAWGGRGGYGSATLMGF